MTKVEQKVHTNIKHTGIGIYALLIVHISLRIINNEENNAEKYILQKYIKT